MQGDHEEKWKIQYVIDNASNLLKLSEIYENLISNVRLSFLFYSNLKCVYVNSNYSYNNIEICFSENILLIYVVKIEIPVHFSWTINSYLIGKCSSALNVEYGNKPIYIIDFWKNSAEFRLFY